MHKTYFENKEKGKNSSFRQRSTALEFGAERVIMSQYVFHCQDCDKEFTQSLHISEVDSVTVKCPHCGSKKVNQLVSAFSAVTAKKS
jgi:putative FmdB family regulatory protein